MKSVAEKLDGQNLTQKDVESRFGVFDEVKQFYRFPDGSAGRLIKIERTGSGSESDQIFRFIYLRTEKSSVEPTIVQLPRYGDDSDRIPGESSIQEANQ